MARSTAQILYTSRSGMMSQMLDMDVVSNNIANIDSAGYKSSRSNFQELLNQETQSGVQVRSTQTDDSQGTIRISSKELDTAIEGGGYFAVTLPDNTTAYTRDGEFMLDSAGNLVTGNGYKLVWQGSLPATAEEVKIDSSGQVMSRTGNVWTQAGSLTLTRFPNPSGLTSYGHSLYQATPVAGTPQTGVPGSANFGKLDSYALEDSNVDMAQEMTHMVSLERAFQISSSVFQQTDTMIGEAIHVRR